MKAGTKNWLRYLATRLWYFEHWNDQRCISKQQKLFLKSCFSRSWQKLNSALPGITSYLDTFGFLMGKLSQKLWPQVPYSSEVFSSKWSKMGANNS